LINSRSLVLTPVASDLMQLLFLKQFQDLSSVKLRFADER